MSPKQFEVYTRVWADFISGIEIRNVKSEIMYESSIEDYESASARLLALNEYMYYRDMIRKLLKEKKEK